MKLLLNWKFISFALFIAALISVIFVKCCTITFQLKIEDSQVVNDYKIYYIQNLTNKNLSEKQSDLFIGPNSDKKLVIKAGLVNYLTKYRFDLPEERGVYKITKFSVNDINLLNYKYHTNNLNILKQNESELVLETVGDDPYIIVDEDVKIYAKLSSLPVIEIVIVATVLFSILLLIYVPRLLINISDKKKWIVFTVNPLLITLFVILYSVQNIAILCAFFLELLILFTLTNILLLKQLKKLAFIVSSILLLVVASQLSSLYTSNSYVLLLTLENADCFRDIGLLSICKICILFLLCFVVTICFIPKQSILKCGKVSSVVLLVQAEVTACFVVFISNTPIYNFVSTISEFVKLKFYTIDQFEKKIQKEIYGKDWIFKSSSKYVDELSLKGKNVIVFFVEGFSDKLLNSEVTPNLYQLKQHSFYLTNYYNHTAATFRGLRGQLSSSYQKLGGYYQQSKGIGQISSQEVEELYKDTVVAIPTILKNNGYNSYFVSSHSKDMPLSNMLRTLGFDAVYGYEDLNPNATKDLDDDDFLPNLVEFLKSDKLKSPYFLGLYNVGTHLGLNSKDVRFSDGKNPVLNTFYSFDYYIKQLINEIDNNEAFRDTVLIITADHSTYPSNNYNDYLESKGINSVQFFADSIPFVMYYKGIILDAYNVKGKNTLAFAPTILHLLGIKNGFNYFLGCSIFDDKCESNFSNVTNIGNDFYYSSDSNIESLNISQENIKNQIERFYNLSN